MACALTQAPPLLPPSSVLAPLHRLRTSPSPHVACRPMWVNEARTEEDCSLACLEQRGCEGFVLNVGRACMLLHIDDYTMLWTFQVPPLHCAATDCLTHVLPPSAPAPRYVERTARTAGVDDVRAQAAGHHRVLWFCDRI